MFPFTYVTATGASIGTSAGGRTVTSINCPTGMVDVGGGGTTGNSSAAVLVASFPIATTGSTPNAWRVTTYQTATTGGTLTPYVICAP